MKKNYRIVKITEVNGSGLEKIYYKIQKQFKFLGLIGLWWWEADIYELDHRYASLITDKDITGLRKLIISSNHKFTDYDIVKNIVLALREYPEILPCYYDSRYIYIINEVGDNGCHTNNGYYYFNNLKDAIGFLTEITYKIKSTEVL